MKWFQRDKVPVLFVILAIWALSFTLPAFRGDEFLIKSGRGYEAAGYSILAVYYVPISPCAWVWPVNIYMLLAPLYARRLVDGASTRTYRRGLVVFALLGLLIPLAQLGSTPIVKGLRIGYYVWQFSTLSAARWFWWRAQFE